MSKWVSKEDLEILDASISKETGEILDIGSRYKRIKLDSKFIMVFDLRQIAERISGKSLVAFTLLVDKAGFGSNANIVDLSSGFKKMLSVELNTSPQNVSKYLKDIKDKDLVRLVDYDNYMINPELLWKGNIADREEAILRWSQLGK